MNKFKKTFRLLVLSVYMVFLLGAGFASNANAVEFNDFVLEVKAFSPGSDFLGVVPVIVTVTYEGAGVDTLTAQNFSTNTNAQIVPTGCSALALDSSEFVNKGDGVYHLGLKPVTALCGGKYHLPIKADTRPGLSIKASGMTILEVDRT